MKNILRNIITNILCLLNKENKISLYKVYEKAMWNYYKDVPFKTKFILSFKMRLRNFLMNIVKYLWIPPTTKTSRYIVKNCFRIINYINKTELKEQEDFDENNILDKFCDVINVEYMDLDVTTDSGTAKVSEINRTILLDSYMVLTKDGQNIVCADNHILYTVDFADGVDRWIPTRVNEINYGDIIVTDSGAGIPRYSPVKNVIKLDVKLPMFDLSLNDENKRYYTNGFLSHNTTTVAAFMIWMLCFNIDKNIAVMANKEDTAKEIVDKVVQFYKGLPYWIKPGVEFMNKKSFALDNGCKVISSATTDSASIGFTIHVLYLDEFAHIPKNIVGPFWRSVFPTLSSSEISRCIVTSTPNGMDNKFFELWNGAMTEVNEFYPIRVDYWQVPGRDEEWARKEKAQFGETEFAQEYELKFNVDANNLIKANTLKFIKRISKPYVHHDLPRLRKQLNDKIKWKDDFNPKHITPDDRFVFSVDTAEGSEVLIKNKKDNDFNVINIFKLVPKSDAKIRRHIKYYKNLELKDCFRLEQVGLYMDREFNEEAVAETLKYLVFDLFKYGQQIPQIPNMYYDNSRLLIEMNFNGRNLVNIFKDHDEYDNNIIISTYHTQPIPGEERKKQIGFKVTPGNKKYYCQLGAEKLNTCDIIVNQHSSNQNVSTYSQLNGFGKVKNSYAGIGIHDDISMTVLSLSRIYEESEYEIWLEDYLYEMINKTEKYRINKYIGKYDFQNTIISDKEWSAIYGNSYEINNVQDLQKLYGF